jgi:MoxR-like ATPase
MGYPSEAEEVDILERHQQNRAFVKLADVQPVISTGELLTMRALLGKMVVDHSLLTYITQIVQQTRNSRAVYLGASPRASVAILQSAKAYALLQGRDFITPDDVKTVAPYALQHRLVLNAEAEMEGYTPAEGGAEAHRESGSSQVINNEREVMFLTRRFYIVATLLILLIAGGYVLARCSRWEDGPWGSSCC